MWRFILHITGIDNSAGQWYSFWSGIGSDLTEFAVIGVLYNRFKCTACWRLAHHKVEGTHYKTCYKHTTSKNHATLQTKHRIKYPLTHKFLR